MKNMEEKREGSPITRRDVYKEIRIRKRPQKMEPRRDITIKKEYDIRILLLILIPVVLAALLIYYE